MFQTEKVCEAKMFLKKKRVNYIPTGMKQIINKNKTKKKKKKKQAYKNHGQDQWSRSTGPILPRFY